MNLDESLKCIYDTNDLNYHNWSMHRQALCNIIDKRSKENLDSLANKSIAIWGAGKCYDIDLKYLSNNFDSVALLDINEEIMKDALKLQEVSDRKNIKIIKIDFLNNTYDIYNKFFNLIMKKPPIKEIEEFLINLEEYIVNCDEVSDKLDKYNISVCLGVHSQLISPISLMLRVLSEFINEDDTEKLVDMFHSCLAEAAKKLNQLVINHSCNLLFMGFDLMELSYKNGTMNLYSQIQDKLHGNKVMDVINIAMQYSVAGSAEAVEDIREKVRNNTLGNDTVNCWIWPYDNIKKYIFILNTLVKK